MMIAPYISPMEDTYMYLHTTAMSATQTVGKSKTSRWITVTIIAKRPIPLSPPPPSREGQQ